MLTLTLASLNLAILILALLIGSQLRYDYDYPNVIFHFIRFLIFHSLSRLQLECEVKLLNIFTLHKNLLSKKQIHLRRAIFRCHISLHSHISKTRL